MSRFRLPPDIDEAAVAAAFEGRRELVIGSAREITLIYLDTFDWRLYRTELLLTEERSKGLRLVLHEPGGEVYAVPVDVTPRMAGDLPTGHLTDRIASRLGLRALIEVGAARVARREGRIQDRDGNLEARVWVEDTGLIDDAGCVADSITTLRIDDGPTATTLARVLGLEPAPASDLAMAAALRGRRPGDYSSKLDIPLAPNQRSDAAVVAILLDLLDTLEANIDGTIADVDTEFLHDLRVAARRTRSALSQLKGVLPNPISARFNPEFKWLGGVTGPLRDLDVFLLEIPTYRSMLPEHVAVDLEALESLITRSRRRAHRTVVRGLQSRRFRDLVTDWRRTLESIHLIDSDDAARPVSVLAAERIRKAHRRIVKKGHALADDPPAEALHRLRIDAKKLRYVLEFFKNLYPSAVIGARITELKQLQDILGGCNDMEVQRHRLEQFAGELHRDPTVGPAIIMTMGRLAGMLEERQETYRRSFHDAFRAFTSGSVLEAYTELPDLLEVP